MRTALLTLLFLLPILAVGQPSYKHLGGPQDLQHMVDQGGGYAVLYSFTEQDTVLAWIEHASLGDPPHYASADLADVVIWCYPQRYPHENHALPNARGRIEIHYKNHGIVFVTER